ncbi:MAG: hypothetical protein Q7U26_18185 [Aquabacterium sp.]|nr:hypothetical protein [Aquabacterium sp.]
MSAAPGTGLSWRYAKTEAGRAEIRQRALPLSRAARNLLLIIDPSRTGEGWLAMVQGCVAAELQSLIDAGLVVVQGGAPGGVEPARPEAAAVAGAASAAPRMSLAQALETKSYQVLYDRITAEARPRLGLIKGYRLILEVERCGGAAEIRALAQRFVEQVRDADGDGAGVALAQVLLAPG